MGLNKKFLKINVFINVIGDILGVQIINLDFKFIKGVE